MSNEKINFKNNSKCFIKPLEQCKDSEIGSKANNLMIIKKKTPYAIPKSLVLTIDLHEKLIKYNNIKDPFSFNWSKFKIPDKYCDKIFQKINDTFKEKPLVIRSSSTCEDSPILSFAGQYSSFLNIKGKKNILNAIHLCYASMFSENAKLYIKLHNIKMEQEKMAIIIQELIQVTHAGIFFTADPVYGDKNKIIIEYTAGLGDAIVSGEMKPIYLETFKKVKGDLPAFLRTFPKIADDLEKIFYSPQDIEWGFDGENIYIFQSRPITTLSNKPQIRKKVIENLSKIGSGKAACLGQSQGIIRIIRNIKDIKDIKRGEIIFNIGKIDIRITTKIPYSSGIITTGGILSHIAVIAREFNKPCLVDFKKINNFDYNNEKAYLDAFTGKLYKIK